LEDGGGAVTAPGKALDVYGDSLPEEIPAYRIPEVAQYLAIPVSTLRSWVFGQRYKTDDGKGHWFSPLIRAQHKDLRLLSFMDLVEAHVLTALRRQHVVPMPVIRRALEHILKETPNTKHPLADRQFATAGKELFIEEALRLTSVTQTGQLGLKECLDKYLQRIERTPNGIPKCLYPFPRLYRGDWVPPKTVVINPRIAYGRPVLVGTSIPTAIIAERLVTGEGLEEIAEDYDKTPAEILEAIRWELAPAA
jgi:uncharacterized protein (DUF433 family)